MQTRPENRPNASAGENVNKRLNFRDGQTTKNHCSRLRTQKKKWGKLDSKKDDRNSLKKFVLMQSNEYNNAVHCKVHKESNRKVSTTKKQLFKDDRKHLL